MLRHQILHRWRFPQAAEGVSPLSDQVLEGSQARMLARTRSPLAGGPAPGMLLSTGRAGEAQLNS